jgi:hypothetical protein
MGEAVIAVDDDDEPGQDQLRDAFTGVATRGGLRIASPESKR